MMERVFIGVDLHKTQFTICARYGGKERFRMQYAMTEQGFAEFLRTAGVWQDEGFALEAGVESTGNTRLFRGRLEARGINVTVINTLKFKVVCESASKTDWNDAATIAEFLEKGMLPVANLCSEWSEQLRTLLTIRATKVRQSTMLKNKIHARLVANGIQLPYPAALQSKKGRQQVIDALEGVKTELVAQSLIEMLTENEDSIKRLQERIRAYVGDENPVMNLLLSIPGCGEVTAWTILAFSDDIRKFATPKKYAAYCGLVPWVRDSNRSVCHGSITKRGPAELRSALVQLVMGLLRQKRKFLDWRLMGRYGRIKRAKGSGKAIIATARKMAGVVWHMLTYNEPFNTALMLDKSLALKARSMSDAALENQSQTKQADIPKPHMESLVKKTASIREELPVPKNILPVAAASPKLENKPSKRRRL